MKAEIADVIKGSIGKELGVKKGDVLVSINGIVPQDLIDYRYLVADEFIDVEIEKTNRQRVVLEIEKDADEDLGLVFAEDTFDGMKRCKNKCIFCFVDQMPPDLRSSLYLKDDDYRLSLLYGNFITMTNLTEADLQRIIEMHLSPIYISVHSADPELRRKLLNNPAAEKIMENISRLAKAGIEMHTQFVLCPGINDGQSLKDSIFKLQEYWPQVKSIAVVPVGITKYQKNRDLRTYQPPEANEIVQEITLMQQKFKKELGTSLVFLADEFYLLAEAEIPDYDHYEGFPQIENGIGLVRFLWDEFAEASLQLPKSLKDPRKAVFMTGISGRVALEPIKNRLNEVKNLEAEIFAIKNEFFGSTVTVAGLLTGQDLVLGLKELKQRQMEPLDIFITSTMLKFEEDVFLDNMTVAQVEELSNFKITVLEPSGKSIVDGIKAIS